MSKAPSVIRVLLVDDHFFVRSGVKVSLEAEGDLRVVAEADSAATAIEQYREHRPDVTLMDGNLPDRSGIEAIGQIRAEFPQARIIMLTINETEEDVYQAVAAGAVGYLTKSSGRKEMLHAIREAAQGRRYFPPELTARTHRPPQRPPRPTGTDFSRDRSPPARRRRHPEQKHRRCPRLHRADHQKPPQPHLRQTRRAGPNVSYRDRIASWAGAAGVNQTRTCSTSSMSSSRRRSVELSGFAPGMGGAIACNGR